MNVHAAASIALEYTVTDKSMRWILQEDRIGNVRPLFASIFPALCILGGPSMFVMERVPVCNSHKTFQPSRKKGFSEI